MSAMLVPALGPAAVAAVVLLALGRPWKLVDGAALGAGVAGLALGAAFITGYLAVFGVPPFPPVEATQWLVALSVPAMLLAWLEGRKTWPVWGVWAARLLLVGATLGLTLQTMLRHAWSGMSAVLWLAGLAVALLAMWSGLRLVATRTSAAAGWLVIALLAAGSALCLALTGSLSLGQLAGAAAAGAGSGLVLALLFGGRLPAASAGVPAIVISGLLLTGYFYSELPAASALLLVVLPLVLASLPSRLVAGDGPVWRSVLVHGAPGLLLVLAAVWIAYRSSPPLEPYY